MPSLVQRLAAEAVGTSFLLMAVVGSGIAAQARYRTNPQATIMCDKAWFSSHRNVARGKVSCTGFSLCRSLLVTTNAEF